MRIRANCVRWPVLQYEKAPRCSSVYQCGIPGVKRATPAAGGSEQTEPEGPV